MARWGDVEVSAAATLGWRAFHKLFPAFSDSAYRHQRLRERAKGYVPLAEPLVPIDLASVEEAARQAARDTAAAEFRRRVDSRRDELVESEIAREVAAKVTSQARHEEILALIEGSTARLPSPEIIPHAIPELAGTPETMVSVISDSHVGKLVREDFVGEGFAYNRYLFHERAERWEATLLKLQALHERAYPVRRLVLPFLGDIVDGVDMRRGHGLRVDVNSAVKQAIMASRAFGAGIARLSAHFDRIDVIWLPGNHGRVGEYGVALATDNWDTVAGYMLQASLADLTNVYVRVREQYHDIVQIGPLGAYLSHGSGIKGGGGFGGIPFYGIITSAAKDTGLHQRVFDLYAIGHFHEAVILPYGSATTILVNGAWDGGDEFSVNSLRKASAPVQWVFGVHPTHGMTWHYPLLLTERRRAATPIQSL